MLARIAAETPNHGCRKINVYERLLSCWTMRRMADQGCNKAGEGNVATSGRRDRAPPHVCRSEPGQRQAISLHRSASLHSDSCTTAYSPNHQAAACASLRCITWTDSRRYAVGVV